MKMVRRPLPGKVTRLLRARRIVVRGTSMCPTLSPGEYLMFDTLAYRRSGPGRGDIVLAAHPTCRRFLLIKRVIAMPGDTVDIRGGTLLVNDSPWALSQSFSQQDVSAYGQDRWALGDGEYFLMGDDPSASTDSRQLGPFPQGHIRARGWLVYWPPSRWRLLHP